MAGWGRDIIVWIGLAGLYLVLAGEVSAVEAISALVAATAGTALSRSIRTSTTHPLAFAVPLRVFFKPIIALTPELVHVGFALARAAIHGAHGSTGGLVRQVFARGDESKTAAGRRAVAVLALSFAPRSFVIREEAGGYLLVHGLPPKPPSSNEAWPL